MNTEELRHMDLVSYDFSNENVLVVDDEVEFGKILKDLLKRKGFQSHHVTNGVNALTEMRQEKTYTFVITDIVMPGMDGLELTDKIRNEFPDVCVIVMTGYSDDYRYVSVINAGATDFINKPFRIEELEAKIQRGIIERNTKKELKLLTITDSLTGLYNQRHFYSRLKDEIFRAKRTDEDLAMILMDLDNFKDYNDRYGHLGGDELLKTFGRIINEQIRQGIDSGFRYGGDEFAIILVDANEQICKSIKERIASAFKKKCNEGVSMGYAIYHIGMDPEDIVGEADRHLYKLKREKKQKDEI